MLHRSPPWTGLRPGSRPGKAPGRRGAQRGLGLVGAAGQEAVRGATFQAIAEATAGLPVPAPYHQIVQPRQSA